MESSSRADLRVGMRRFENRKSMTCERRYIEAGVILQSRHAKFCYYFKNVVFFYRFLLIQLLSIVDSARRNFMENSKGNFWRIPKVILREFQRKFLQTSKENSWRFALGISG